MKKLTSLLLGILLSLALVMGVAGCGETESEGTPNEDGVVAVESVKISRTEVTLSVGSSETLTATISPSNATDKTVEWSTSNAAVATVSDGEVTGVSAGTATITVTTKDGGKTASCAVTVKAKQTEGPVAVEGVSLTPGSLNLTVGSSGTLTATITPSDATEKGVEWSTSNDAVATVSGGEVTGVSAGTATITVTTKDGGKTATCTVTVSQPSAQKMSEEEFWSAIERSAEEENYTAEFSVEEIDTHAVEKFAHERRSIKIGTFTNDRAYEIYAENIEGEIYIYSNNSGEWLRTKINDFSNLPDYFENASELVGIKAFLEERRADIDYDDVEYNANSGIYTIYKSRTVFDPGFEFEISFTDGKISSVTSDVILDGTVNFYGYGTTEFERPQHQAIDQSAYQPFKAAVEKSRAAKNFTMTLEMDYEGGPQKLQLILESDKEKHCGSLRAGGAMDGVFYPQQEEWFEVDEQGTLNIWGRMVTGGDPSSFTFTAWQKSPNYALSVVNVYREYILDSYLSPLDGIVVDPTEYLFILTKYDPQKGYVYGNFDITNHLLSEMTFKIGASGYVDEIQIKVNLYGQDTDAVMKYSKFDETVVTRPSGLPL